MSTRSDDDIFDAVEADMESNRCISAEEDARAEREDDAKTTSVLPRPMRVPTVEEGTVKETHAERGSRGAVTPVTPEEGSQ